MLTGSACSNDRLFRCHRSWIHMVTWTKHIVSGEVVGSS